MAWAIKATATATTIEKATEALPDQQGLSQNGYGHHSRQKDNRQRIALPTTAWAIMATTTRENETENNQRTAWAKIVWAKGWLKPPTTKPGGEHKQFAPFGLSTKWLYI